MHRLSLVTFFIAVKRFAGQEVRVFHDSYHRTRAGSTVMRSGVSRYHASQAGPMEYPGTMLDQSRQLFLAGLCFKQALSLDASAGNTRLICSRSDPIDKGGSHPTSSIKTKMLLKAPLKAPSALNRVCASMQGVVMLSLRHDDSRWLESGS